MNLRGILREMIIMLSKNKFYQQHDIIIVVISKVPRQMTEGAWVILANILLAFRSF